MMKCRMSVRALLSACIVVGAGAQMPAQDVASFTVDAALPLTAGQPEITLRLDENGETTFGVIRKGGPETSAFAVHVATLQDAQGRVSNALAEPAAPASESTAGEGHRQFTAASGIARVRL